jgi:hypothetical protein
MKSNLLFIPPTQRSLSDLELHNTSLTSKCRSCEGTSVDNNTTLASQSRLDHCWTSLVPQPPEILSTMSSTVVKRSLSDSSIDDDDVVAASFKRLCEYDAPKLSSTQQS